MKKNILIVLLTGINIFSCDNPKPVEEKKAVTDTTATFSFPQPAEEKRTIVNGPYEEKHPNGLIKIKGEYADGKRHGTWLSFYSDGKIWSEGAYRNGIRHGAAKTFYPGGSIKYEGFYTEGKESGIWKFWDENGKLVKEVNYDTEQK